VGNAELAEVEVGGGKLPLFPYLSIPVRGYTARVLRHHAKAARVILQLNMSGGGAEHLRILSIECPIPVQPNWQWYGFGA
jgi:hypothetical protein